MTYQILDDADLVGCEPWEVMAWCLEVRDELEARGRWPAGAVLRYSALCGGVILEDGPWRDWTLVSDVRMGMLVRVVLL